MKLFKNNNDLDIEVNKMTSLKALNIFDKYYYETYNDISKYVVCNCNNIEDVKDIIQSIYLEVYKKVLKESQVNNYHVYIMGIAKHKVKDYYRFKYKTKITNLFNNDGKNIIDNISSNINIEESLLEKENIEEIWKYLKRKKVIISKIFYLYYYTGYSIKEISKELEISESNIKNYLYRTLKELKLFLEEND